MKYSHCADCGKEKLLQAQKKALCGKCAVKHRPPISEETRQRLCNRPKQIFNEERLDKLSKASIAFHERNPKYDKTKRRYLGHGKWAKSVKERDGACIDCGSIERLEAHHLVSKAKFPEVASELWNGITLCHKCHIIEHKIIGYH